MRTASARIKDGFCSSNQGECHETRAYREVREEAARGVVAGLVRDVKGEDAAGKDIGKVAESVAPPLDLRTVQEQNDNRSRRRRHPPTQLVPQSRARTRTGHSTNGRAVARKASESAGKVEPGPPKSPRTPTMRPARLGQRLTAPSSWPFEISSRRSRLVTGRAQQREYFPRFQVTLACAKCVQCALWILRTSSPPLPP